MTVEQRVKQTIERFNAEVLLPTYREIAASLERRGDAAVILDYDDRGREYTNHMLQRMHADAVGLDFLYAHFPSDDEITEGEAEYVGPSLFVVRGGAPAESYVGRFIVSARFRLGPEVAVHVYPVVMYHMAFNDRLHKFEHRYDADVPEMRAEQVTREHVIDHFIDSFEYFKLHARDPVQPW